MKHIFNLLIAFSALSLVVQCSSQDHEGEVDISNGDETSANTVRTEYLTSSGSVFVITEDKSAGASISSVTISGRGFKKEVRYRLANIDPVSQVLLSDLDANGQQEIFIITQSAGSGSYSKIYGYAVVNDGNVEPISIPEPNDQDFESGGTYEGFMGHNKYTVHGNYVVNSFPVYLEGDVNASPSGGGAQIRYVLQVDPSPELIVFKRLTSNRPE